MLAAACAIGIKQVKTACTRCRDNRSEGCRVCPRQESDTDYITIAARKGRRDENFTLCIERLLGKRGVFLASLATGGQCQERSAR